MYRLNGKIKVIQCDAMDEADREALASRGKAWVYNQKRGWWYVSMYSQHYDNWKIGPGKRKGKHNYFDVTQLRPLHEVPEDYKLHALLLGN